MGAGWIFPLRAAATLTLTKLFPRRYQRFLWCSLEHRVGPVFLCHHASVPCEVAFWVARHAEKLWEALQVEFPKETQDGFVLDVICDRHRGPGFKPNGDSRAIINLSRFFLDTAHPSFESQERSLRGTLAEELHHVVRGRRFGEEPYVFRGDGDSDHPWLEELLHYALNEFETEALRFCVRATGDRAELLAEVEKYLERRGRESP